MISRRTLLLAAVAASAMAFAGPTSAFTTRPYEAGAVKKEIASGKRVVIHVYATWCLQCRAQASILAHLATDKTYDRIAIFRVDYTGQGDIVKELNVPRSTLIAYKGGKEVSRMSWGTSTESVENVLKAVL